MTVRMMHLRTMLRQTTIRRIPTTTTFRTQHTNPIFNLRPFNEYPKFLSQSIMAKHSITLNAAQSTVIPISIKGTNITLTRTADTPHQQLAVDRNLNLRANDKCRLYFHGTVYSFHISFRQHFFFKVNYFMIKSNQPLRSKMYQNEGMLTATHCNKPKGYPFHSRCF